MIVVCLSAPSQGCALMPPSATASLVVRDLSNPGLPTIESELFAALHRAGIVSDANASDPRKYHFNRAARTDKGVHAAGQVVSMRVIMPPDFCERLNAQLPPDIRVFG